MVLEAKGASRQFIRKREGSNVFYPVKEANISLQSGEVTVISGASGSGKSTLMNMLCGILSPTEGEILLDDANLYAMDDKALSALRNRRFGIIPQVQTAIHSLTVEENILLPGTLYGGWKTAKEHQARAQELQKRLGISSLKNVKASELSGGELRRMAIARALLLNPDVVFADEPTSDLDEENTALVLSLLKETAQQGSAVLIITHDKDVFPYADVAFRMKDGILAKEKGKEDRTNEDTV